MTDTAQGPLHGIRVLDFTTVLSGPYATRLLADHGAEVLKIEPPGGDHKRTVPPLRDGQGSTFAHANAGKKSLVLDLKTAPGRRAARDLAAKSAVVVQNWRPDVAGRLGLGYDDLRPDNPALVYCAISGYGQTGARALRPAYAPIVHADSGYERAQMAYQADPSMPPATGLFVADFFAGMAAFGAISAALVQSRATGIGQVIDVAMFDAMLNLMMFEWHQAQFFQVPRRIYPPIRTLDGHIVVAPVTQRNVAALTRAIGRTDLDADPRFASAGARIENWAALMAIVADWAAPRSSDSCEAAMRAHSVPFARYREAGEHLDDAELRQRGAVVAVRDQAGEVLIPAAPWQMPGAGVHPRPEVPALGSSTREVLSRILGYDEAEIARVLAPDSKT